MAPSKARSAHRVTPSEVQNDQKLIAIDGFEKSHRWKVAVGL